MSFLLKTTTAGSEPPSPSPDELQDKIMQVRELVGSLSDEMMAGFLSDSTIRRFLRARNWSTQQATRALKETVRWRRHYRPERIRWDDIAEKEWEARRAYIPDYLDNTGRRVLISKPAIKVIFVLLATSMF
ncbi:hypothetical protein GUJ93_ZPchr0005g14851 [Zizania palustris]|uniref:CRAL/TRIO N-terminal domain-containing protein n=1 Tax=Zizania palustris TaxID=103762 RepID=A0A8J5W0Q6_ZIZPA|nr:hypothetical protein GUJ93_ZPchr0005g14851 [Zizania palustris]